MYTLLGTDCRALAHLLSRWLSFQASLSGKPASNLISIPYQVVSLTGMKFKNFTITRKNFIR